MHVQNLDSVEEDDIDCDASPRKILEQLMALSEDGSGLRLSFEDDHEKGVFETVFGGSIFGFMTELREAVGADDKLTYKEEEPEPYEHFVIVTYTEEEAN